MNVKDRETPNNASMAEVQSEVRKIKLFHNKREEDKHH